MRPIRWSYCATARRGAYRDVGINGHVRASTHSMKVLFTQDRPHQERIAVLCTKHYRTSPPAIWIQVLDSSAINLGSTWFTSVASQVTLIFSQSNMWDQLTYQLRPICRTSRASYKSCAWLGTAEEIRAVRLQSALYGSTVSRLRGSTPYWHLQCSCTANSAVCLIWYCDSDITFPFTTCRFISFPPCLLHGPKY